jgi:Terminase RNaseH-like domain
MSDFVPLTKKQNSQVYDSRNYVGYRDRDKSFGATDLNDDEPKVNSFDKIAVDADDLVEILRYDYESFILLFLHGQDGIEFGVPDFHNWIMSYMCLSQHARSCFAIPRDHAKTTLAKLASIHLFIYSPSRFLVYLSNTSTIAIQATRDIVNFIREPHVCAIYGEPVFTQQEEARGNYMFQWRGRRYIIRSLGAGQQVRGMNVDNQRPDLAIIDDLESAEEDVSNKLGYEKLKRWLYGTFMKALDRRRNKIIQIGNLVSNTSILWDHLNSPDWKSIRLAAITNDNKPLWPARWTVEQLRLELLSYIREGQMYIWLAEMMNMPITSTNQLLDVSQLAMTSKVYPDSDGIKFRCITVDPAISDNMAHANAAVVACHTFNGVYWQLADVNASYGVTPYELYDIIMDMAIKWKVRAIGIEDVNYQRALIHVANYENARRGYVGFHFLPVKAGRVTKTTRILTWLGMIRRGLYRFTIDNYDIFDEVNKYDVTSTHNKDDTIDCCAYIIYMITHYLDVIAEIVEYDGKTPTHHAPTLIYR